MIPSRPNPLSLRCCLPGRTYSTCAQPPFGTASIPSSSPHSHSTSVRFRLLSNLCRQPHLLSLADDPALLLNSPQPTDLETQQYPLKSDLPPKV
jgi:hypothetical protein